MSQSKRTQAQVASDKRFSKFRQKEIADQLMAIREEASEIEQTLQEIDLKFRCTCNGGTDDCEQFSDIGMRYHDEGLHAYTKQIPKN